MEVTPTAGDEPSELEESHCPPELPSDTLGEVTPMGPGVRGASEAGGDCGNKDKTAGQCPRLEGKSHTCPTSKTLGTVWFLDGTHFHTTLPFTSGP